MIEAKKYDDRFYDSQIDGSYRSAQIVLPIINDLIRPKSILDVGCGTGTWLKVWKDELLVNDIVGIDGDYVNREQLKIPVADFIPKDLKKSFDLHRKFDLVMCLEVGEHLPDNSAQVLVGNLVKHGHIILFSAANLHQHGTYHINEQPPEYWARIFKTHQYVPVDIIRGDIWNNDNVEWWYRQNIILYADSETLYKYRRLEEVSKFTNGESLFRIHPLLWKYRNEEVEERSKLFSFLRWKLSAIKKNLFSSNND